MTHIAVENHHVQWENPIQMVLFNSYVKFPEGIDIYNIFIPKSRQSRQSRCMMTPRLHMSAMWSYFPARTLHSPQTSLHPHHLMTRMIQIWTLCWTSLISDISDIYLISRLMMIWMSVSPAEPHNMEFLLSWSRPGKQHTVVAYIVKPCQALKS